MKALQKPGIFPTHPDALQESSLLSATLFIHNPASGRSRIGSGSPSLAKVFK